MKRMSADGWFGESD